MIEKIMSGGQTGVDRAALDVAIALGIQIGGFVPANYRADDGQVPERYRQFMQCTSSPEYEERTRRNVEESDATAIVSRGQPVAGTALTVSCCRSSRKAYIVIDVADPRAIDKLASWISRTSPRVLNVAGPRERTHPGIGRDAAIVLRAALVAASHESERRE
jgi:hypothetical protein